MKRLLLLMLIAFSLAPFHAFAAAQMADGNDYTNAASTAMPPAGRGPWQLNGNTTGSTSFIKIIAGDLTGTTTPALAPLSNQTTTSPTNPPAHLQVAKATTNSREYYRSIGNPISNGAVYFSFLLNVTVNPTKTDEFMGTMIVAGLSNAPVATDPLSFHARMVDATHFNLGIERLNGPINYAAASLADNTNYLIVLKYTFGASSNCQLFINPTPGAAEPLADASAVSDGVTVEPANIGTILFYEAGTVVIALTSGTYNYDVLRVDANWSNVTPAVLVATRLGLTPTAQTLAVGQNSSLMTVTLQDQIGNPITNSIVTVVNLSSTSSNATFWDATDTTNILSVTIPTNSSTASFYYLDYATGNPTITASSSPLVSATQTETVNALFTSIDHFDVTTSVASTNAGQNFIVTVQAKDSGNNPITNNSVDGAMVIVGSSGAVLFAGSGSSVDDDETEEDGAFSEALMNGAFTLNATDNRAETITITATYGVATGSRSNFVVTPGGATQVRVETAADGTGIVVPQQVIPQGNTVTVFAIRRDAGGNFIDNVAADSWSLAKIADGVASGDLVAASNRKSAVFTANNPGTATIHAIASSLTITDSGLLTVPSSAPAIRILVETAADGTGIVVPAQMVIKGMALTAYAIRRDTNGYFIDNVAANSWSLVNLTGGLVSGDLAVAPNSKSAVFTANYAGSAAIHATSGSLITTNSGTLTVPAENQTGYTVSYQVNVDATEHNITGDAANEPNICIDPTNPNRMAIGWRQFASVNSSARLAGYAYTTNGGVTWLGKNILEVSSDTHSDPVLRAAPDGLFYYMSQFGAPYYGSDLWNSTNGGQTWTKTGYANGGDKPWFAIDNTTNRGRGNLYFMWNPGASPQPNANRNFCASTNRGVTWSTPKPLPQFPTITTFYGTISLGPAGEVYIAGWDHAAKVFNFNRATNAPNGDASIHFDLTITNLNLGGAEVGSVAGINNAGLLGVAFVAADCSTGTNRGNVYAMCSVSPSGNPTQVEFIRSTNGGVTWSAPKTINDDASPLSHYHWSAVMDVAPNGRIDVAWYDTRNATNNTTSQLYYSYSLNGGLTWSTNRALSPQFNQTIGYPVQQKIGEQFGLVSLANSACITYAATFNGEEDVYFTRVDQPTTVIQPFVTQIIFTNGGVKLSWAATVGKTYCVEFETLLDPRWSVLATNLGCLVATNAVGTVQFPISPDSKQGFYRVLEEP
jgi:hypothetical protein